MATQQQPQPQQQPLWKCVCSHLNKTSKRCSNCKRWRGGSRPHKITAGENNNATNAEMMTLTASQNKRAMQRHLLDRGRSYAVGESTVLEEGDAGNEECIGNEDVTVSFHVVLPVIMRNKYNGPVDMDDVGHKMKMISTAKERASLEEAAAAGCKKCKKEHETGVKTADSHDANCPRKCGPRNSSKKHLNRNVKLSDGDPKNYDFHRVSLEEAAAAGCKKCKKEHETGVKTTKSHDVNCPRRRKSSNTIDPSVDEPLEEGDPPWRTRGNAWLGRRILYNPETANNEIRSCSKYKFYNDTTTHQIAVTPSSAIKGTIRGFISDRDKDSNGEPGFTCSRSGQPANLFHVVFDAKSWLLYKDFEEWEIKEQCEWIDDEESDEEESEDDESEVVHVEKDKVAQDDTFEYAEDTSKAGEVSTNLPNKKPTSNQSKSTKHTSEVQITPSIRNVTPKQGSAKSAQKKATDPPAATSNKAIASNKNTVTPATTDTVEKTVPNDKAKPNFSNCSSFNEALKSALSTYASSSASKSSNNPPPPVPPPFLSHQEESTLRTALAFVLIRAKNKKKQVAGSNTSNNSSDIGSLMGPFAPSQKMPLVRTGFGRTNSRLSLPRNQEAEEMPQNSTLFQGLLSRPRKQGGLGQRVSESNAMVAFERELNHIRDIMKLSLSLVLPLYEGALETVNEASLIDDCSDTSKGDYQANDNVDGSTNTARNGASKRLPSSVYDFEASYNPQCTGPKKSTFSRLDGLCHNAATRLTRLINGVALTSKFEQRAKLSKHQKNNETIQKSTDGSSNQNTETSDTNSAQTRDNRAQPQSKSTVRDEIVKLFYTSFEKAYHYEYYTDDDYDNRRIATSSIEKIMATCHVIHRLLFFDQSNSFSAECIVAVSQTLSDLYNDEYYGAPSETTETSTIISTQSSRNRVQVVRPNWLASRTSYLNDRNERRGRAIDAIFPCTTTVAGGGKRKNTYQVDQDKPTNNSALPDSADVLAVNLLRLLECASDIRLRHQQKKFTLHHQNAATQIINEIRSTRAADLTMPIHLDEVASFYLRESHALHDSKKQQLLGPCAKMMLRVHFFGLVKKLSAFE
eukprot:scaffold71398_cov41-Cyclotella_meneghiniana.AAC.1